ncbi:6-phosphofructokinase [Brevibacterium jeotgali]|uniref:ATP-dependent 6-phosphofructokinase n=1 Tax=Brevibacterium jeotgali TaxID=1262550 RepID=A0A2H1L172_9MICO|nr:ATP-dependent 6-phosphofructokinase [Brevibacterium jeotgali]TWC02165.1 6-phosphofructokinase 1 [Brevibacterium jeotgali]SMY10485.1 6-phosphofructokinase [Brevibacterium jeotgali]
MRIGIMTSGGDGPGLNAVIRGAVRRGTRAHQSEFAGIRDGWRGLLEDDVTPLTTYDVRGLSGRGGTILGTSRAHPYSGGGPARMREVLRARGIDAVIAIGGEGTLAGAARLADDEGLPVVGVPKTIDNDLDGTDYTFGFDTAAAIATESIDRLRTTAESHHRCMVVEVMGRHVGWIALHAGMAAGAHAVLLPEFPVSYDRIHRWVRSARARGRAPIVVVAEGFVPEDRVEAVAAKGEAPDGRPRLGGIADELAPLIEEATGIETRSTVLGHLQRGGSPTAYDRVLSTRLGMAAADIAVERAWGQMASLDGTDIVRVRMADAVDKLKRVPQSRWDEMQILLG